MSREMNTLRLSHINVYPVKSCKGISLKSAELTPYGLANDRQWMVVDQSGVFLSQRTMPKMALIEVFVTPSRLALSAPGQDQIEIVRRSETSPLHEVRIWKDSCSASDCGDPVADWLSSFLGISCRLVTMSDSFVRHVDPAYSRDADEVGFADAFPFLLISTASLRDLNSHLELPIPMNRFRPNLVVEGCHPYAEDGWIEISIGSLVFRISKPCARCTVPTVDQDTGIKGLEPLRTLATIRRGTGDKVFFGQNLINENKFGTITVGSEIKILATGGQSPV